MSNGSKVARNGSTSKTGGLGKRVITCIAGSIKKREKSLLHVGIPMYKMFVTYFPIRRSIFI